MFTYCTKQFFKMHYEKANVFLLCTMPSVSERGDMDLVNHSVVIQKNESHSVELTVSRKENWLGTVQYIRVEDDRDKY